MLSLFRPKNSEFTQLRWSFTTQRKKDKLLQDTIQILRLLPETQALLNLAAAKNIDIRFNENFIGTDDSGVTVIDRNRGNTHIEIKPYRTPEDSVIALIHELRHVWQNDRLGLTPRTMALGEPDAKTALLLNRVKEADAYAYTDLVIMRLNNAQAALAEGFALEKKLLEENAGAKLSPAQEDAVSDLIAAHVASHIEDEKALAARSFAKALSWMDGYDREMMVEYHRRYTSPFMDPLPHLTEKDGHVVTLADIRKLTVAGEGATLISYLDHLDDKAFTELVMKGIDPLLLDTAGVMKAFESASSAPERSQYIDAKLRDALHRPARSA